MTMELPHRKATQTTLMFPAPRLITARLNAQKEHFPVPGRGHQRESRTTSDVLPAVQAPGRIRTRLGEPGGAVPARFPNRAVSHPLRSLPGPPSHSWDTPSRQVHLPGPGSCAKAGYLSQVGGRRAGCWKEAACTASGARYPAANFVPVSVFSPLPSGYVTAMPVDTLSPVSPGAPATPALPFRLRTKVPGYLLPRPADGGARKPSAVERLEADKAKYVKSLRVANTRQEPVQPPLVRQPLFSPGPRGPVLTPSRRVLPCSGRRPQLDLDILSSLINLCDSPVSPTEASRTPGRPEGSAHKVPPATPPRPPPSTVAVRRVDVRPLPASPARPYPSPGTTTTSSPGRPPGLQRSKSDLSERFSRAAADLERFFNFCGLDPEEARGLGVAHLARASSDIVSLAGPSAGPCSSEGGCSHRSSATVEERALERVPYGVSVIERNARVIKWLYGLRQARDPPATEG